MTVGANQTIVYAVTARTTSSGVDHPVSIATCCVSHPNRSFPPGTSVAALPMPAEASSRNLVQHLEAPNRLTNQARQTFLLRGSSSSNKLTASMITRNMGMNVYARCYTAVLPSQWAIQTLRCESPHLAGFSPTLPISTL
jgi:hypothetical protein